MESSEGPSKRTKPDSSPPLVESRREQLLIEEALKVGKSKIQTWAISGRGGSPGFQMVGEEDDTTLDNRYLKDIFMTAFKLKPDETLDRERDVLVKQGIYEIVVMDPLVVNVTATREISVPHKSFFRTKQRVTEETYVSGQRPQTMREATGSESDESAVEIWYYASDRGLSGDSKYRDARRRPGNIFEMIYTLPISLAKHLSKEIQKDPTVIRRMTEAFVQRKYSERFRNETWNTFGKPPYGAWDESKEKRKMYFADFIEHPEARNAPIDDSISQRVLEF